MVKKRKSLWTDYTKGATLAFELPVAETFHSIQGEGVWTGTQAAFIRLAGCNLKCSFCDTDHKARVKLTIPDLMGSIRGKHHVVITGGEPTIHNLHPLTRELKNQGHFIQVETNGTGRVPPEVDWVTMSPKFPFDNLNLSRCDELKIVWSPAMSIPVVKELLKVVRADHYFIQPLSGRKGGEQLVPVIHATGMNIAVFESNLDEVFEILPVLSWRTDISWRLSLQTQKLIGVQ